MYMPYVMGYVRLHTTHMLYATFVPPVGRNVCMYVLTHVYTHVYTQGYVYRVASRSEVMGGSFSEVENHISINNTQ